MKGFPPLLVYLVVNTTPDKSLSIFGYNPVDISIEVMTNL
jgi:hypothetical protein